MAETYYAYMVMFGDQKAIVMTPNSMNNSIVPMLYSEREYLQRKEELERTVKDMVNASKKDFLLMKFSDVNIVDVTSPDNMMLQ